MWAMQTVDQANRAEPRGLGTALPGGGLRPGTAAGTCGDLPLLLALAAEATGTVGAERGGAWAVVGLPQLGALAAADAGLDLGAGMWVDHPGRRWPEVVATAVEAVPVVLLGLPAGVRGVGRAAGPATVPDRTVRRVGALLRRSGSVLLVAGHWPGAEVRLRVSRAVWQGVDGEGYGLLRGRRTRVAVGGRGAGGVERAVELWLPGPQGAVEPYGAEPARGPVLLPPEGSADGSGSGAEGRRRGSLRVVG
ncbi:hypothetical protein MTQ01_08050 [Streptomyces sp. XM4193]|uniref:hypothetical protein n=1 Tax=Streptomyces sp. XM4193 TaxID=2929782 RepID=UPI001FF9F250|nr:hypothetical protein [Streptomyces sp. XM4193]MCK1795955.1 hypothetical protein [Streptomyces sp. XM4193]